MAGRTDRAKGRAKESAGALAGDKQLKNKGRVQQVKGSVKKRAAKAKRKVDPR